VTDPMKETPNDPGPSSLRAFLVTIDVEGDNLWHPKPPVTTENAAFLPRFQELCERYALRPTYLVNWEMCHAPSFRDFGRDVLARGQGEIGIHPHAWNIPPVENVPARLRNVPMAYLVDYPAEIMWEKLARLKGALEETFQTEILTHRAARWAMDGVYAQILMELDCCIDCSVTPYLSWSSSDDGQKDSLDYRSAPEHAYRMDLDTVVRPGESDLLEVPMTIFPGRKTALGRCIGGFLDRTRLGKKLANRLCPSICWFRPDGKNGRRLVRMLGRAAAERRNYVEFMLHSSELMPGGSPLFPTRRHVEALYDGTPAGVGPGAGWPNVSRCGRRRKEAGEKPFDPAGPVVDVKEDRTRRWVVCAGGVRRRCVRVVGLESP